MEKKYEQKLDIYYVSTITYLVTLILYGVVSGTLIGERFEMVWKDPIVYLLALCAVVTIGALIVAAVLGKSVIIRQNELVFATRFKERSIQAEDVEWIAFRRGSRGRLRQGVPERAARIKLKGRRRRLWLRPSGFDEGGDLIKDVRHWATENSITVRAQRKRRKED